AYVLWNPFACTVATRHYYICWVSCSEICSRCAPFIWHWLAFSEDGSAFIDEFLASRSSLFAHSFVHNGRIFWGVSLWGFVHRHSSIYHQYALCKTRMAHQSVFIRSDFNLLGWGFVVHVCIRLGKVCALCLFTNELIKRHHLVCRSNTVEKEAGLLCHSL